MLTIECLKILKNIHDKGIIHRDIKPENIVIGDNDKGIVYLIDFGLSNIFFDNNHHIPFTKGKNLTGTMRYASIRNHLGYEQSRRDDLESLFYTLIYLGKGKLPWQGIPAKTKKEKNEKICQLKRRISIKEVCGDLPSEYRILLLYIRNLSFNERPNYEKIINIFELLLQRYNQKHDLLYDWVTHNYTKKTTLKKKLM